MIIIYKDNKNVERKLEEENRDLKYLVGALKEKTAALEEESRKKNDRLTQLQEHNLKAVIQTPGNKLVSPT